MYVLSDTVYPAFPLSDSRHRSAAAPKPDYSFLVVERLVMIVIFKGKPITFSRSTVYSGVAFVLL